MNRGHRRKDTGRTVGSRSYAEDAPTHTATVQPTKSFLTSVSQVQAVLSVNRLSRVGTRQRGLDRQHRGDHCSICSGTRTMRP